MGPPLHRGLELRIRQHRGLELRKRDHVRLSSRVVRGLPHQCDVRLLCRLLMCSRDCRHLLCRRLLLGLMRLLRGRLLGECLVFFVL